jgi:hypothetical protein
LKRKPNSNNPSMSSSTPMPSSKAVTFKPTTMLLGSINSSVEEVDVKYFYIYSRLSQIEISGGRLVVRVDVNKQQTR